MEANSIEPVKRVEGQAMSKIIKFPRSDQAEPAAVSPAVPGETAKAPKRKIRGLFAGVLRFVWVAVVLVWPVLK